MVRAVHERFGRLAWSELFDAAVVYARDGIAVGRWLADWLAQDQPILAAYPPPQPSFCLAIAFHAKGSGCAMRSRPFDAADRQPRRARWLLRRFDCRARLYGVADQGSPLRADDFAAFHAEWVEPIRATYRGYTVYELPPNTQGFTALQILNLLEGYDVAAWGEGTADYYHHMAEAVKLAFATARSG